MIPVGVLIHIVEVSIAALVAVGVTVTVRDNVVLVMNAALVAGIILLLALGCLFRGRPEMSCDTSTVGLNASLNRCSILLR